tara:strand:- start:3367 stop:3495 length:129 start_codon:yes stop_codon:yes gene_type:complete
MLEEKFAAAQAAQKVTCPGAYHAYMFAAAQAAQKLSTEEMAE